MGRSELREHIFKMIFGMEFSDSRQMEEQLELYLDQLDEVSEKDRTYMIEKAKAVAGKERDRSVDQ